MKKCYQMNGYNLYLIPTNKFKNITISVKLQNQLNKETVTMRTLLSFMLTIGTKDHPSTQEMAKYLEGLYGMKFGTSVSTKGLSHIININSICINEEYLPYKEDLLKKQIQILNDLFNHPNASDHCFNNEMFTIKKKELKDKIISNQDDKFSYSLEKLFEYFGKDQALGISTHGYLKEVDKITNEQLFEYFQQCIQNDQKNIFVVGNIDERIVELFDQYLVLPKQDNEYQTVYNVQKTRNDLLEIIEKQDITQAKLNMGYRIEPNYLSNHHYAFVLFNAIFGSSSQSKLFKVVREQHSLCYYISSSYDAFNGMMVITAGIEGEDYEKAKTLIQQELKEMQEGHFSDDDINIAKLMIKNSYTKAKDEPMSMIALMYNNVISNKDETIDEYIKNIELVSKQDIIDVCQNIELDTIFLLEGRDK